MAEEGVIHAFSGEEAAALYLWHLERDEWSAAWRALRDHLKDNAEMTAQLYALDTRLGGVTTAWAHVIHARFARLRPDLLDLAALICFPELMPTPDSLDDHGRPTPWTDPLRRRDGNAGDE